MPVLGWSSSAIVGPINIGPRHFPSFTSHAENHSLRRKGDRTLPSNYRPISLTSIILCCKLLEHIIYSNIMDHLDQHSVLSDKQHGFHSKHSTETQLILTTHDLSKSLNNKSQVDMIIIDFSKAFDTVPHNRLQKKLKDMHQQQNTCLDF